MALSISAVELAYKVFNELEILEIPSWPEDMATWDKEKRKNPPLNTVLGYDKKSDNGWENLVVFIKEPSEEFKINFERLKSIVPNSSISKQYSENNQLWIFGWF